MRHHSHLCVTDPGRVLIGLWGCNNADLQNTMNGLLDHYCNVRKGSVNVGSS